MNKIILRIIEGKLIGTQFEFTDRTGCIMGRHPYCHPRLPDDQDHNTISRYHCLLDINPPNIRVRDFGSRNGTYVNGRKIGQRKAHQTPQEGARMSFPEYDLKSGDQLKLSDTVFEVEIQGTKPILSTIEQKKPTATLHETQFNFLNFLKNLRQKEKREDKAQDLKILEDYQILQQIGKGGCSEVFLVCHQITGELAALKMLLPQVAAHSYAVESFLREAKNTQALNHPNIVQLKETGYYEETFFFTLEYCNHGTVEELMVQRGGKLSVSESLQIIFQVLDALIYAHNAEIPYVKQADGSIQKSIGLVHRDIKPANIFLLENQGEITAKLADYGLSKAFDLAGLSGQTLTGNKAGTPYFMCRQQVLNFKYVQPDVDIWAVAATLYNMLTGCYPRDLENKDPFLEILQDTPIPIRQRDATIPQPLAKIIDLALQEQGELYFKDAALFKEYLLKVCDIF
ncbi:MAG: protein kinase [Microcystaceae cyanobacterium]